MIGADEVAPFKGLTSEQVACLAKKWGYANGYRGRQGGFIYKDDKVICQGWRNFFNKKYACLVDALANGEIKLPRKKAVKGTSG
jgi:hypothetical protein